MRLTNKQELGLRIAIDRYRNKEPYTVISGYAGSGKSTLIPFIIEALDIPSEEVAYVAFTGKAAQVLRTKGCPNATTAHKLLYKAKRDKYGNWKFYPKSQLDKEYKLIVVDEISLLPQKMWELMLTHNRYIIACGDPGQLPAISEGTNVLEHPHIFLDEIMRQAQESEIIRLTMDIREGKVIRPFKGKEINIVKHQDFITGMYTWADQIICAKNTTRHDINDFMRRNKWGEDVGCEPRIGDTVICTKNNWEKTNGNEDALVNGLTGTISKLSVMPPKHPVYGSTCYIDFSPSYEGALDFNKLLIDWKLLISNTPTVTKETFKLFRGENKLIQPNEFEYGYAITCHKSQGSEWPKVLVIAENYPWKQEERIRWLYTAATRASEKLTLVLND